MLENSIVAERLTASQEGLSSMEFDSNILLLLLIVSLMWLHPVTSLTKHM
jgi:hypothetical protein